ncbi:hypothetical protein T01_2270 [Trichinella spiralis]|uniref:Uncharacterized protein n=1 Tax=Trichinella spiralis TaxID=6334 RepID=A0A0V1B9J1_TRISP|nr:hypothetical protein T01_2270 [Trichinella spiralis]
MELLMIHWETSDEAACHTKLETQIFAVFFCKLRISLAYLTAGNVHVSFANHVANGYVVQALRSVVAAITAS